MSKLVFRSMHESELFSIAVEPGPVGVRFKLDVPSWATKGVTISFADARQLRDFLNKELGEQASEPMGTGQAVYLETDSRGNNTWEQFPTIERAKSFADKRVGFGLKYQAVGLLHQQLVPVVTTSYEWKEIG